MSKITTNPKGITLKLTTAEAVALESILGLLTGDFAQRLPLYDDIADALEDEKHNLLDGLTISRAIEAAHPYGRHFRMSPQPV